MGKVRCGIGVMSRGWTHCQRSAFASVCQGWMLGHESCGGGVRVRRDDGRRPSVRDISTVETFGDEELLKHEFVDPHVEDLAFDGLVGHLGRTAIYIGTLL